MKLLFEKFYRIFGLRTLGAISSPRVLPMPNLSQWAVLHSLTDDKSFFPDVSSPFIRSSTMRVPMKNVTALIADNHSVGRKSIQVDPLISAFLRDNKNIGRFIKPITEITDRNQMVVVNYNLLKATARYTDSNKMSPWFSWFDMHKTMWEHIDELCAAPMFYHFFEVKVTQDLAPLSEIRRHLMATTAVTLKDLHTPDKLFLLDFFRWLDPETRPLSSMSAIKTENLKKVNLIFRIDDGRTIVVNLGYLNSWLDGQPNQTEFNRVNQLAPNQLRMMILKFQMVLQNLAIEKEASDREAEQQSEDDGQSLESDQIGAEPQPTGLSLGKKPGKEDPKKDPYPKIGVGKPGNKPPESGDSGEAVPGTPVAASEPKDTGSKSVAKDLKGPLAKAPDADPIDGGVETVARILKETEEDIQALEEIHEKRKVLQAEAIAPSYDPEDIMDVPDAEATVFVDKAPEERLAEHLDTLVANNRVSAADYKKIQKTLAEQMTKPNPYNGKGTLKEATTIKPEEVKVKMEEAALKVDDRVIDKSVASCSIEPLTRNYVTKVLRKHTLKSILGIQSSGVLVSNIETEIHNSVMGAYERHAITLKPLEGQSSTVYVRVPVVEPDGTFKSNGVKYYVRTQRTDLPIRKVAPDRVSLSSFMTKMFVYRSPKASDSSVAAVIKYLTLGTIGEAPNLLEVKPANVYDNLLKTPFIFGALSSHFKTFKVANAVFGELTFDFGLREEVDGKYWKVGTTKKGRDILVGHDNNFHILTENGPQPLGDIFDILELDRIKAPVDFAVTKTMGKTVPVGLILARALGLRPLLKLLKVKYRTVKTRTQKNLGPHEYYITFADYVFIFDRRDIKASLILAAFQSCEKVSRQYNASVYDHKEVYDNLFDVFGCNAAFMRELDLLESSFVDPITKEVLAEMKEPLTWLGLLVRSCEMLQTYDHPNIQDLTQQQLRGFERFPGFVYKEMIKSVRAFRNKNVSGRSKVEMSPFSVWQAIRSDPTVSTSQDINPIQNLKSHEAITFVGEGGRSKDAFMKDSRAYDPTDAGAIAEASVDSGDVGINIFMCANPKIDNIYGMKSKDPVEGTAGNYLSTSLLLAAGSQHDDQIRSANRVIC